MMESSVYDRAQRYLTLAIECLLVLDDEVGSLVKKRAWLVHKSKRGKLEDDDELALKDIEDSLEAKKSRRTFWEVEIRKANKSSEIVEDSVTCRNVTSRDLTIITGVNPIRKTWTDFTVDEHVFPSDSFMQQYETNCRVWSMNSEAGRRTFLDLFLRDVVGRHEFHSALRIFCEQSVTTTAKDVGHKRRKLTGKHDYTIGHAGGADISDNSVVPDESHIIVVNAKKAWDDTDIWQCIAETAALYRTRKDAKKSNCNVWGICSNASLWRFVHIDDDGQIWVTDEMCLPVPSIDKEQVFRVYRFVYYVVKSCYLSSPTTSPDELDAAGQVVQFGI